jgi:hypothetical protein
MFADRILCGGASQKRPWRLISELGRAEIIPVPRACLVRFGDKLPVKTYLWILSTFDGDLRSITSDVPTHPHSRERLYCSASSRDLFTRN